MSYEAFGDLTSRRFSNNQKLNQNRFARADLSLYSRAATVVIATHDGDNWHGLCRAVRSVLQQTCEPGHLIVCVDHDPNLARQVGAQWTEAEVTVVENDGPHRGASATRNVGARLSRTPFIAFLDDDEVAEPDWLARLLAPFDDRCVVGTGGRYVPAWDRRQPAWFPDELAWAVGGHHSGMPSAAARVRNVWSGNMAVRAEQFHAVGGFREGFGKAGRSSRPEDTDLCIRMSRRSSDAHWLYIPDARIRHTVPADRSTFTFFLRRCYAEGAGKIELRNDLQGDDTLGVERSYLTRTIPEGISGHVMSATRSLGRGRVRDAATSILKAIAIVAGVGAAAAGALSSTLRSRRRLTTPSG